MTYFTNVFRNSEGHIYFSGIAHRTEAAALQAGARRPQTYVTTIRLDITDPAAIAALS
ncbi:hypothetical protein [Bradyrhizobium cosmicum]|uniref:hypothetical protein n=1 Tax=Bradyrhizobium cosmicum TaxID=1404864 RepID=UPI0028EFFAC8|nr:hypothetical protein [Bradyrhizobium cosmicum]